MFFNAVNKLRKYAQKTSQTGKMCEFHGCENFTNLNTTPDSTPPVWWWATGGPPVAATAAGGPAHPRCAIWDRLIT